MAEYIDREALIAELKKYFCSYRERKGGVDNAKLCNGCEFLNIDEYEQDLIIAKSGVCHPHICQKYNKRVKHFPYSEPYIHPCEECEKGGVKE